VAAADYGDQPVAVDAGEQVQAVVAGGPVCPVQHVFRLAVSRSAHRSYVSSPGAASLGTWVSTSSTATRTSSTTCGNDTERVISRGRRCGRPRALTSSLP